MTLALGTLVADNLILASDSMMVVRNVVTNEESHRFTDKKLFSTKYVGIATYGGGPRNLRVPMVLWSELRPEDTAEWKTNDVIGWLQRRFKGQTKMHALVGGVDERGKLALFDVCMDGSKAEPVGVGAKGSPQLVLRGDERAG